MSVDQDDEQHVTKLKGDLVRVVSDLIDKVVDPKQIDEWIDQVLDGDL